MKTKNILFRLILISGLFLTPGFALVDIAGILETGNVQVTMDGITWYLVSSPAPVRESTPGWGGPAGTTDTVQLEQKSEWPQWAELFYQVNGIPNRMVVDPILPDTWYDLFSYDLQGSRVRFEDTVLVGISTPTRPAPEPLSVRIPNPITGNQVQFNLALEPGQRVNFSVYDISGQELLTGSALTPATINLNLTGRAKGVYLLRIRSENLEIKEKLLLVN